MVLDSVQLWRAESESIFLGHVNNQTSAPIGARKCNFRPFSKLWQTNRQLWGLVEKLHFQQPTRLIPSELGQILPHWEIGEDFAYRLLLFCAWKIYQSPSITFDGFRTICFQQNLIIILKGYLGRSKPLQTSQNIPHCEEYCYSRWDSHQK